MDNQGRKGTFEPAAGPQCTSPPAPQMAVLVQLRGWQGAAYASTAL